MFPIVLLLIMKFFPFSWSMSFPIVQYGFYSDLALQRPPFSISFWRIFDQALFENKNILDYFETWYWKEQVEVFVADAGLQHEVSTFYIFSFFPIPQEY